MHNEFWMCQRDLARTYESVVESWSDDEIEGSYDECDVEFSVLEDLERLYEGMSKKDTCEVIQYCPKSNILFNFKLCFEKLSGPKLSLSLMVLGI